MRIFRNVDRLHRPRIDTGIVHTGRDRGRCRIKVLHLLRHIAKITEIFCQFHSFCQGTARVQAGAITKGQKGKELADIDSMVAEAASETQVQTEETQEAESAAETTADTEATEAAATLEDGTYTADFSSYVPDK